ncbi:MAG TPA: amidohydrolase family protein [Egibacteraceae bacterium]|nr:amidohydrolase family protein [Egibacteraceae bacterium]
MWQELALPGLIDLHVHFMPKGVMDKVWAYFDAVGPLTGISWPIAYRTEEQDRLARLRAMGVLAFPSLVYPHKPDMATWLNSWAAGFAAAEPDVLRTATFHPEPGAAAYVRTAIEEGAQVFKAHLQVGAYDPRDPLLDEVWGQLAEAAVPVVVHCGSGPTPGPFTGPGPFGEVLARHPRLTAVVAHMGMPEYEDFLAMAERYPRVHLDTTMAFTDFVEARSPFPPGLRSRLADLADRVLLGSDFPNTPYPYAHQVEALLRLDLGDYWLRRVLHDNADGLIPRAHAA